MFIQIKRLFSHTAIYGLGNFISRGINFLLVPLLTNTISPQEYGKLGIIQTFIGLAEVFFVCGMRQAILRYAAKEDYSPREAFSAGVFWIVSASALCLLVLKCVAAPLSAAVQLDSVALYHYMLAILVLDALSVAPYTYLQSVQKPVIYAVLKIIHVVVYFAGCFFLIVMQDKSDVGSVLTANIVASALLLALCIPVYVRNLTLKIPVELIKRIIRFGLPYVPNIIFVVIIDLIDRVLIARILDVDAVGYYSAAVKLAMIMFLLVVAFQTAWIPFFLSHLKDREGPRLFSRVFTYYCFVACLVFLVIGIFYNEIAAIGIRGRTFIGPDFRQGLYVIPVILAAYIFCGVYSNFIVGIHAREKTTYVPFITFTGALVNVVGNLILIPRMGIGSAALSTLFSYITITAVLFPIARRLYAVPYEWPRVIKICLAAGLVYMGALYFENFIVRVVLVTLYLPLLYGLRFFEHGEVNKIKELFSHRHNGN
jgi:O-antigen/teichoic acid export membrane protein